MPELGGLDLSPIALFILIQFVENGLVRPAGGPSHAGSVVLWRMIVTPQDLTFDEPLANPRRAARSLYVAR